MWRVYLICLFTCGEEVVDDGAHPSEIHLSGDIGVENSVDKMIECRFGAVLRVLARKDVLRMIAVTEPIIVYQHSGQKSVAGREG